MMKSNMCPICESDISKDDPRCETCGWILAEPFPAGKSANTEDPFPANVEPLRTAWLRVRVRERALEVAAKKRERELAELDRLLSERASLLSVRAAAFDNQRKNPAVQPSVGIPRLPVRTDSVPEVSNRLETSVEGLDDALGGGIPRGHIVVVEGAPGTLKSSLGLWILSHCVETGGQGLYVTVEENAKSLLTQARALGLKLDSDKGGVWILDARTISPRNDRTAWLAALKKAVKAARGEEPLDLVVIDSLDGLEVLARFRDRRLELFRFFQWLRALDATVLVIAERADYVVHGAVIQPRHEENFLADGVLHLRSHPISDTEVQRRIRIVKMRGTRHRMDYLAMHVAAGEFEVAPAMGV